MAADRIRVGEADVLIAGGAESMAGAHGRQTKPLVQRRIFAENVGIASAWASPQKRVAQQWKVSREMQDDLRLESPSARHHAKGREFTDEITPIEIVESA